MRLPRLMIISCFVAFSLLVVFHTGTASAQPGCNGCVYYQGGSVGSSSVMLTASAGCASADNCHSQNDVVGLEYCGNGNCVDPGWSCTLNAPGSSPASTCKYSLSQCPGSAFWGDSDAPGAISDLGAVTGAPCMVSTDANWPCGANVYCDSPNYPSTTLGAVGFGSSDTGTYTFCEFDYSLNSGGIIDTGCTSFTVSGGSITSTSSSTALTYGICTAYNVVTAVIFVLSLLLMILGGAVYAGSSFVPGQMRGTIQGYGMGMVFGGVGGAIIAQVAPYILQIIIGQSITSITALCPV